eukprot:TRINITY_DN11532_c0_g1_i1.p1 TRINITY_DN11532_c0_g1~~TRINITY_DN11532_c0_g1_i1.p1  ORF type:complete len:219 (-),score=20.29 TRINITY_DN11532_c0_g1_i1:284-940(-)
MNSNKYFRQKNLPFKYLKNPTTCCQPFANLPLSKESQKMTIILSKSSSQKTLPQYKQKQNSQLLQLPKIAKQQDSEYLSEISNTSGSTQKPKISRINSQKILPKAIKKIPQKQPSFDLNANASGKNLRYNRTIIRIKEMKQINGDNLVLTERTHRSKSQSVISSLLERRGIHNDQFKLNLDKSNFNLKKENLEDKMFIDKKKSQKLLKYFNPEPVKLQ